MRCGVEVTPDGKGRPWIMHEGEVIFIGLIRVPLGPPLPGYGSTPSYLLDSLATAHDPIEDQRPRR